VVYAIHAFSEFLTLALNGTRGKETRKVKKKEEFIDCSRKNSLQNRRV